MTMAQQAAASRTGIGQGSGRLVVPVAAVRLTGALLALGVATVHVADQGGITAFAAPPSWIGWSYRIIEVAGVLTALALLLPWPRLVPGARLRSWSSGLTWGAAVLLGLGPFVAYLASRTVGLPGDPGDVGNWGYWLGTVSLFIEAGLMALSVGMLVAWRRGEAS